MSSTSTAPPIDTIGRGDVLALIRQQLAIFAGALPAERLQALLLRVTNVIERTSSDELSAAVRRAALSDPGWGYHPPSALGRAMNDAICEYCLSTESVVRGVEHLAPLQGRRVLLLCNHLSYADAHVVQGMLRRAGLHWVCDRLTVIAGPKVFDDPGRRLTAAAFGVIKTPQSQARAVGNAVMAPREVAQLAARSIECACEHLRDGDVILLFPEGTRSRTQAMQPGLPAVARYLRDEESVIVPLGLMGSEHVMGCQDDRLREAKVELRIGRSIEARELAGRHHGNAKHTVDAVCAAIAEQLEAQYRGVYTNGSCRAS